MGQKKRSIGRLQHVYRPGKKQKGDIIWQQDVIFRKKRIRYRLTGLWKQLEIMIEIIVETDKEGVMMNIQELEKRIKLPEAAGKAADKDYRSRVSGAETDF